MARYMEMEVSQHDLEVLAEHTAREYKALCIEMAGSDHADQILDWLEKRLALLKAALGKRKFKAAIAQASDDLDGFFTLEPVSPIQPTDY